MTDAFWLLRLAAILVVLVGVLAGMRYAYRVYVRPLIEKEPPTREDWFGLASKMGFWLMGFGMGLYPWGASEVSLFGFMAFFLAIGGSALSVTADLALMMAEKRAEPGEVGA